VIVVDGRTVLTGRFNFTNQAEHEHALAQLDRSNFHAHRDHCQHPGEVHLPHVHLPHVHLRKAA